MEEIAPLIPERIIQQFNDKYKEDKDVKKPNITNGLTPIKINLPDDHKPVSESVEPDSPFVVSVPEEGAGVSV